MVNYTYTLLAEQTLACSAVLQSTAAPRALNEKFRGIILHYGLYVCVYEYTIRRIYIYNILCFEFVEGYSQNVLWRFQYYSMLQHRNFCSFNTIGNNVAYRQNCMLQQIIPSINICVTDDVFCVGVKSYMYRP